MKTIAVIGASGAIGRAFTEQLSVLYPDAAIHGFTRTVPHTPVARVLYHTIDYGKEESIAESAILASSDRPLDMVIVATGMLHDGDIMPEKSLKDLSAEKFLRVFEANAVLPALIAKHYLPKLHRENRAIFAALSARVGSVSDNRLGGWYAYRASKAALNMIIKNAAIEVGRRNKQAIIVGLHPGTVESHLSTPFQNNVAEGKLFKPEFSAAQLLGVLDNLTPEHSGRCFAWDGEEVAP